MGVKVLAIVLYEKYIADFKSVICEHCDDKNHDNALEAKQIDHFKSRLREKSLPIPAIRIRVEEGRRIYDFDMDKPNDNYLRYTFVEE